MNKILLHEFRLAVWAIMFFLSAEYIGSLMDWSLWALLISIAFGWVSVIVLCGDGLNHD